MRYNTTLLEKCDFFKFISLECSYLWGRHRGDRIIIGLTTT